MLRSVLALLFASQLAGAQDATSTLLPRPTRVSVRFLQNVRSWIVLPARVAFDWSADGKAWHAIGVALHAVPVAREGVVIHPFAAALPPASSPRYVRVRAHSAGPLPVGHPGAGRPSWLFADEVVVR